MKGYEVTFRHIKIKKPKVSFILKDTYRCLILKVLVNNLVIVFWGKAIPDLQQQLFELILLSEPSAFAIPCVHEQEVACKSTFINARV